MLSCSGRVCLETLFRREYGFAGKLACIAMELRAKHRNELKKKVKSLRRAGFMPAVFYGEGVESQAIAVLQKDFDKAYREAGESTLMSLDVDGEPFNVLIHDKTNDPIRGTVLHADFLVVRMDKEIRTKVVLQFVGESPAVKNEGGILIKVLQELEVEALPKDLPHTLEVDLSKLDLLESKLQVSDIIVPRGVKLLADPEDTLVLVEPPRATEELEALAQVSVGELKEVKTEQELKREAEKPEEEGTD